MTAVTELGYLPRLADPGGALPVSPPGVIGAAVVTAARHSAGMTRRRLARAMGVSPITVRAWENGTCPLYCAGYQQLCQLADALADGGAQVGADVGELVLVSQCDLLLRGMLCGFEDYAEVPPIEEPGPRGDAARGFLRWALAGVMPSRFLAYAVPGSLLARPDVATVISLAQDLCAGGSGDELAAFGAALTSLAEE